jgi:hypothetical protein
MDQSMDVDWMSKNALQKGEKGSGRKIRKQVAMTNACKVGRAQRAKGRGCVKMR